MISWTRLIARRFDDPLIGRDLLVGVACGAGLLCLGHLVRLLPAWTGDSPVVLGWRSYQALGSRQAIGELIGSPVGGVIMAMI